ncbi:ferredoxin family protein [Undibacterium cyanobacteriorum]|uniref:Ferredoxin n=1 Tax=Undibacterium cyanobacteriorum TaxID=3073561 RepID=A0ABY9RNH5_9BURK|nr:ferredoxin FdxA [Undibacterium sp. 20NA77.5]WMW81551.1 ferredoxin family protein [Undibacterium sp. 20NA77.5]
MTYVVTEACIGCKHTDCIQVCPVDCFHEGQNFLVIDPQSCVDCGLCEVECPVDAIRSESELKPEQQHFLALNAELSQNWPRLVERKPALPNAAEWAERENKLAYLIR